jgi:O-antigen/teichoic acid export membrane protein
VTEQSEQAAEGIVHEPDRLLADDVGERVITGSIQRGTAFVVANLLGILAAIIVLRYLGVAAFGRYGTVMALLMIVLGITDAGLTITATREMATVRDHHERRELLAHVVGLRIALAAVGVCVAIAFAVAAGYDDTLVLATLIGGLGVIVSSATTALLLPLAVELRNSALAVFDIVRQAVLVAAVIIVVLLGGQIVALFAAQMATALIVLALTPFVLRDRRILRPRLTAAQARTLMLSALPLAISAIFGVIYFRLLVVLMSLLASSEQEVGLYVTSARVVEIAGSMPYVLMAVLLPVVTAARQQHERLAYITSRTGDAMALSGISLALLLAAGAEPIVVVLGGHRYEDAASVLEVQAFALGTIFLAAGWSSTLIGLGRQRWIAYAAASGLVAALALGLLLIPADEANGAAIAAVLADLVLCVVTYVGLRRANAAGELGAGWLLRLLAAMAPGVALVIWSPIPPVANALLAVASFLAIASVLGFVPSEILDRGRSLLARRRHSPG